LILGDGRSAQVYCYTQPFPYQNDPDDMFDSINAPENGNEWVLLDAELCAPAEAKSGPLEDPFAFVNLTLVMPDNRSIQEGYIPWDMNSLRSASIGGIPPGQCRRGPVGLQVPVGVRASQVQLRGIASGGTTNRSWLP